jgi:succinylglutamate desuccinylase
LENTLVMECRNRLVVLLGNPKGVMENKRYIDVNLNRIFHAQTIKRKHGIVPGGTFPLITIK